MFYLGSRIDDGLRASQFGILNHIGISICTNGFPRNTTNTEYAPDLCRAFNRTDDSIILLCQLDVGLRNVSVRRQVCRGCTTRHQTHSCNSSHK